MADRPDPRIPTVFHTPTAEDPPPRAGAPDPLRLCVATTVALIAWLVTPPLAVMAFAAMGLVGYWRARRAGLLRSRCALGDTRLVLAYLAAALVAGTVGTVLTLTG